MKASDLMIGDWVQVPSELNRYKRIRNTFDMDEAVLYKPIPLTPEILKKNDFKYGDGYGYSFVNRKELSGDGFEEEKVYINTAINTLIIYTAASSMHLPIKYIHKLQHALKLCGIEKEIEL